MKKFRQSISILLSVVIVLLQIPAFELRVFAEDTSENQVGKVLVDSLDALGFNTDTDVIDAVRKNGTAPYGTHVTNLLEISELFVASGYRTKLWDGTTSEQSFNNQRAALYNYKSLNIASLKGDKKNVSVLDDSDSYSKITNGGYLYRDSGNTSQSSTKALTLAGTYDFIRSSAFDPNGTGRKTHIAQVCGRVRASQRTEISLRVLDAENGNLIVDNGIISKLPFRVFATQAGAWLSVETGDFDGDGKDEIAVYRPAIMDGYKYSEVAIYKLAGNTLNYKDYVSISGLVNLESGSSRMNFNYLYDYSNTTPEAEKSMREYPVVDLAAVKQSSDITGVDDLIITVSYSRYAHDRPYGTDVRVETGVASRVFSWIDPLTSNTKKFVKNLSWSWGEYLDSFRDGNYYEVMMSAGAGAGDIDGDGANEVVISGYRLVDANIKNNVWDFSKTEYLTTYLKYDPENKSYSVAQLPNWVSFRGSDYKYGEDQAATNMEDSVWNDTDAMDVAYEPPEVVCFAERGNGYPDSVLVGCTVVALNSQTNYGFNGTPNRSYPTYRGYPQSGSTNLTNGVAKVTDPFTARYTLPLARLDSDDGVSHTCRYLIEAAAGNFDANFDGKEQIAFTYVNKKSGENNYKSFVGMIGTIDSGSDTKFSKGANTNGFFSFTPLSHTGNTVYVSVPVTIAAVDTDKDSTLMRYLPNTTPEYYFSDPRPIMLLQAAPYFEELGDNGGSTTYGKSKGGGTGSDNSVSISAGSSIGFEQDVGVVFKLASFKQKFTSSMSVGYTNSMSSETVESISYTTSDEDSLILSMTPYIRYHYEVFNTDKRIWVPTVVDYPMATELRQISVEYYDKIAEQSGWQTIRGNILHSVPGDPSTYPSFVNGWNGIKDFQTVSESVTTTVSQEITESTTHGVTWGAGISLEIEVGVVGMTSGVCFGIDYSGGYTWTDFKGYFYEGSVGNIPSVSPPMNKNDYSFKWQFGWHKKKLATVDPSNPADIVVIGYLVKEVRALPKPISNLHVKQVTDNSVTLAWSEATGKVKPAFYRIFRKQSGILHPIGAVVANSTGLYEFTDLECTPGFANTYVIKTSGYVGNSLLDGPESNSVIAYTSKSLVLAISNQPTSLTRLTGETATFSVTANPSTGASYTWQVYDSEEGWTTVPGYASVQTNTMNLSNVTDEMNGNNYRCIVTRIAEGQIYAAYSNSAVLTVGKILTNITLASNRQSGLTIGNNSAGNPITVTATVASGSGVPDGTVIFTFINNDTGGEFNQTASVSNGLAQTVWTPKSAGQYSIKADYNGSGAYQASGSTQNITYHAYSSLSNKMLSIGSVSNDITYGDSLTLSPTLYTISGGGSTITPAVLTSGVSYTVTREGDVDSSGILLPLSGLILNNVFTPTKAGRYTINATYTEASVTYTEAKIVTVAPAQLKVEAISPAAVSVSYLKQNTETALNAALLKLNITGLKGNESVAGIFDTSLDAAGTITNLAAGRYNIVPVVKTGSESAASTLKDRYIITYVPGVLEVSVDTAVVTFIGGINGKLSASCNGAVIASGYKAPVGSTITFTAVPDSGYSVEKWTGADANAARNLSIELTVSGAGLNVSVAFIKNSYIISQTFSSGGKTIANLKAATGNKVDANLVFYNYNQSGAINLQYIMALYDKDSKLVKVTIKKDSVIAGEKRTIIASMDFNGVIAGDIEEYKIITYVWDDENMVPFGIVSELYGN